MVRREQYTSGGAALEHSGPGTPRRTDSLDSGGSQESRPIRGRAAWLRSLPQYVDPNTDATVPVITERFEIAHAVIREDIEAYIARNVKEIRERVVDPATGEHVDPGISGTLYILRMSFRAQRTPDAPNFQGQNKHVLLLGLGRFDEKFGGDPVDDALAHRVIDAVVEGQEGILPPAVFPAEEVQRLSEQDRSLEEIVLATGLSEALANRYINAKNEPERRRREVYIRGMDEIHAERQRKIREAIDSGTYLTTAQLKELLGGLSTSMGAREVSAVFEDELIESGDPNDEQNVRAVLARYIQVRPDGKSSRHVMEIAGRRKLRELRERARRESSGGPGTVSVHDALDPPRRQTLHTKNMLIDGDQGDVFIGGEDRSNGDRVVYPQETSVQHPHNHEPVYGKREER